MMLPKKKNPWWIFRRRIFLCAAGAILTIPLFFRIGRHWSNNPLYPYVFMPIARMFDSEFVHKMALWALKYGYAPNYIHLPDEEILESQVWSRTFRNPIGLAAGFDKNGSSFYELGNLGFGFVECGTITPQPQAGNPKPRVFRLTSDKAIINRYGFNNVGLQVAEKSLSRRLYLEQLAHLNPVTKYVVVGANVGTNKGSENPEEDYVNCVKTLGNFVDYIVVNVSSPNTPKLRELQEKDALESLVKKVQKARESLNPSHENVPILIKIAPDLTETQRKEIAEVSLKLDVDGIIVSNTTISRPDSLKSRWKTETGGLSGKPILEMSNNLLKDMYVHTKGKIPLIGSGGIFTGQDALEKIELGASLVQLYTSLAYEGPQIAIKIRKELADLLEKKGYSNVMDAIGAKVPEIPQLSRDDRLWLQVQKQQQLLAQRKQRTKEIIKPKITTASDFKKHL